MITTEIAPRASPDWQRIDEELIIQACEQARAMMETGATRSEILTQLAIAAERVAGRGSVASILVLDDEGLLRNGASPSLPADYLAAIDRIRPRPDLGTCAAAAATGRIVVTPDFCADDKWAELRHLPIALGFAGAWSMPIKAPDGTVVGTFGTYYREARQPTADEQAGVASLAKAASLVLAKKLPLAARI